MRPFSHRRYFTQLVFSGRTLSEIYRIMTLRGENIGVNISYFLFASTAWAFNTIVNLFFFFIYRTVSVKVNLLFRCGNDERGCIQKQEINLEIVLTTGSSARSLCVFPYKLSAHQRPCVHTRPRRTCVYSAIYFY